MESGNASRLCCASHWMSPAALAPPDAGCHSRLSLAAVNFSTIGLLSSPEIHSTGTRLKFAVKMRLLSSAALGGSPKAALDSNRIFTANFSLVPVLWISGDDSKPMVEKLTAAKLNLEWQPASGGASAAGLIQWLAQHKRDAFPLSIDCETNSPTFSRCYWIQPTKFDAGERNDVLPSTRIPGGTGAALDLGGFGFKMDDPGPGVGVTSLPEKYGGPLKAGDRLI